MARTTTVIIGAGQAGLAMSRCLSEGGIEHVVLERGHVAERWRSMSSGLTRCCGRPCNPIGLMQ